MKTLVVLMIIIPALGFAQKQQDVPYIQHQDFALNGFSFPITIKSLMNKYGAILTISKKPIKNIHRSEIVDTIYTFQDNRNKFEIYKAKHAEFLSSATINSGAIPLKYNIRIGDSKVSIAKRLKTRITADKVMVGDMEGGHIYTLTFPKNKLISVSFEGDID